jgi:hypothetical protein
MKKWDDEEYIAFWVFQQGRKTGRELCIFDSGTATKIPVSVHPLGLGD